MTISPGSPITAADLASIWFGPELIYNTKDQAYETHVVELDWTGFSQLDPIRVWVPPADAQILGMIATSLSSGIDGAIEIELTGNVTITGTKYLIPVSSTPTRVDLLGNQPRVKVGAGDALFFTDTASQDATNPAQFRIHILYQTRWTSL